MPNLYWKRKLGNIWPRKGRNKKIILLYHSIGDTKWGLSEYQFNEQVHWLSDYCQVLPITDLIQSKWNDSTQVAISFDDGYKTLFQHALPILSKKNINAMVYLNTGWIGEDESDRKCSDAKLGHYPEEEFLTWNEVHALHKAGWEIGSHGINHYNFAIVPESLAKKELQDSKIDIEKHVNNECIHFSYPWGRYSSDLKKFVAEFNYKYATAVRHGSLQCNSDLFALPRINIAREYSLDDFKDIIKGKWDYLGIIHRMKGL